MMNDVALEDIALIVPAAEGISRNDNRDLSKVNCPVRSTRAIGRTGLDTTAAYPRTFIFATDDPASFRVARINDATVPLCYTGKIGQVQRIGPTSRTT